MIVLALLTALAGSVELSVEGVGGPVTQTQRLLLQSTLQRVADFYDAALGVRGPAVRAIHVEVHHDRARFEQRRRAAGLPDWSDGWFGLRDGRPEAVLWGGGAASKMRRIFLHEASHHLLSASGRTPRWLDEGLAQVIERAHVRGNLLTVAPSAVHVQMLAAHGRPTVEAIVTHRGSWLELPAEKVGPLYSSAWALTAMLLSTPDGQATLRAILAEHRRTPGPAAALRAIDATWPGGLPALEAAFSRWADRPPRTLTLPSPIRPAPARSDALWIKCKDGRLVNRRVGCR